MAQFQVIRAQVQSGEAACCRNANEAQRKREREKAEQLLWIDRGESVGRGYCRLGPLIH